MLTPAFELSQDRNFLTILIKAKFAKISDTEIFIEENDFKFFSKPYFLRLTLPGNIVENGQEKADYDVDKGTFTIQVPKETPGEHFEGLDMITKLLAPRGQTCAAQPLIQVLDNEGNEEENKDTSKDEDQTFGEEEVEEEFDWSIPQTPYSEEPVLVGAPSYGFASQKSGVFQRLQEELHGIVDCQDPDQLTPGERRQMRVETEQAKFDEGHYLADLYEDEMIQPFLAYQPPWLEEWQLVQKGTPFEDAVEFTEEEKDAMRKLPRKEYLLDPKEETQVYLGLVDIVYSYAYNHRTTLGENNVESGWNISKISPTLSWLEVFNNVQEVLVSCYRRSLCYPLYRHWGLCGEVLRDVVHIFRLGRRRLLKCLLEVQCLLRDQESRYVLNDLYITDYCVWIQSASTKRIQSLVETLSKISITKEEADLGLVEAEGLLNMVDDVDAITGKMSEMSVEGSNVVSDRDSDDDSGEEDSSEYTETDGESDSIDSDEDLSDEQSNTGTDAVKNSDSWKITGDKPTKLLDSAYTNCSASETPNSSSDCERLCGDIGSLSLECGCLDTSSATSNGAGSKSCRKQNLPGSCKHCGVRNGSNTKLEVDCDKDTLVDKADNKLDGLEQETSESCRNGIEVKKKPLIQVIE